MQCCIFVKTSSNGFIQYELLTLLPWHETQIRFKGAVRPVAGEEKEGRLRLPEGDGPERERERGVPHECPAAAAASAPHCRRHRQRRTPQSCSSPVSPLSIPDLCGSPLAPRRRRTTDGWKTSAGDDDGTCKSTRRFKRKVGKKSHHNVSLAIRFRSVHRRYLIPSC